MTMPRTMKPCAAAVGVVLMVVAPIAASSAAAFVSPPPAARKISFLFPSRTTARMSSTSLGGEEMPSTAESSSKDDEKEASLASEVSRLLLSLPQLMSEDDKSAFLSSLRSDLAMQQSLLGALGSMTTSLLAHPERVSNMLFEGYSALYGYLKGSEIWPDIEGVANARYLENRAMLGALHMAKLGDGDRRDESAIDEKETSMEELTETFPMEEAQRYVKYAVAAYGDAAMQAAKLDVYQEIDLRLGDITKTRVAEHIGIPEDDLVIFDVGYDGAPDTLRHFVALDHKNEKVILAIRGTWTHQEVMVDVNGYSRPFYGGQAHLGISLVSERLWEILSDQILSILDSHPTYEFIVTGHSLGGGATCCLNVILHNDPKMEGRKFRCFAWASPPVCTLDVYANKPQILETAVNYVHRFDDVPFLSGDTVRRQIEAVNAMDRATREEMDVIQRAKILTGMEDPPPELVEEVYRVQRTPVPEKEGVPRGMSVPVKANVWFWESTDEKGKYDAKLCDSLKMAEGGIFIHPDHLADHLPARYEYVMTNLVDDA